MQKYYFISLLIAFYIGTVQAQEPILLPIRGVVTDVDKQVLPFASVALYKASDSSLVQGLNSDENGRFEFAVPEGVYRLNVQFLSYQNYWREALELKVRGLDLGNVSLKAAAAAIQEVVVGAERKAMEIQLDKRVYNVDKDPMNKGRNASDILDNLPSVSVDIDGNVSLRGSGNVRILVDGKPSGLIGIRGAASLKNLQGNIVDKIEIITNPSARYDAEGEVGIINIVLKKDKKKGLNGSFDARAGYPEDFGGGLTLNYRTGVVNFFVNGGLGYNKRPGSGWSFQQFETADTSFSYERLRQHKRGGWATNFRTGANFYLTEQDVITASALYSYSYGNNEAQLDYTDFDQYNNATQRVDRDEAEIEVEHTIEASLDYKKTFKKKGQEFTVNFQFTDSKDEEQSAIQESSNLSAIEVLNQRVANKENEQKWLVQTDYIHPWGKDGKIEAGLKAMLRSINNDFKVEEQNNDDSWDILEGFDNQFLYNENIYAAYLMAGNKWGKFQGQLGLRAEYSDVKTNLVKTATINQRRYLDFFPSANLSYEFKHQNNLQLSYSRRISRPRFWSLLPFFGYSDARNLFGGNPNLNPEYTHSIELGHLKYFEKGSILSSVYYRHTTGKNERLVFSDSTTGITQMYPVNIGLENSLGLELALSYKPWAWWDVTGSANFFRAIMQGEYLGVNYDNDTYAWTCNLKSKWTIAKIVHVQVSFNYNSPRLDPQGKLFARYNIDAALSVDLFNGKGSLTLNARDIFNTRKRRYLIYGADFSTEGSFQWRARQVTLNFSYRLNQSTPKRGRK